jgi:hypothetical protein
MARDDTVRTYDPKLITIIFGPIIVSGYVDGTFVSVDRAGDSFEKDVGADGTVDRTNKNRDDFTVTLTLKQTSLTNDLLSATHNADKLSNAGKFPLTIKDLNGTTTLFAAQAWVAKDPTVEEGNTSSNREWRLETGPGTLLVGGNIL